MREFIQNIFRQRRTDNVYYTYYVSTVTNLYSNAACSFPLDLPLYSTSSYISVGDRFFTNTNMTTPFVGNSVFRRIGLFSSYGKIIVIDNNGYVISLNDSCYPQYFLLNISNSTNISNCQGAGVNSFPISVYSRNSTLNVGSILYNDQSLTTRFEGDNTWYSVSLFRSYRINNLGIITQIDESCAYD